MESIESDETKKVDNATYNDVISYLEKLKENAIFLLGLGGIMFVIVNFHYAVMKIRENEYYDVNTDLINESILIDGVRNYLEIILFIVGLVGLYIALMNLYPNKKRIQVQDKPSSYNYLYMIVVVVILISLYIIYQSRKQYDGDIPNTIQSFLVLSTILTIHFGIISFTFFTTVKKNSNNSFWDLNTALHYGYIIIFTLAFIFPFFYINNEIVHSGEITMTSDKKFMLIERDKNQLLLRKTQLIAGKKYRLLDEYVSLNVNELNKEKKNLNSNSDTKCVDRSKKIKDNCNQNYFTLEKIKIDENISYEKKKYIILKN